MWKVQISDPVVIFRLVCVAEVVVVTTSDTSFAKERKASSGILFDADRNSRCREGASVCTMIEVKEVARRRANLHAVLEASTVGEVQATGFVERSCTVDRGDDQDSGGEKLNVSHPAIGWMIEHRVRGSTKRSVVGVPIAWVVGQSDRKYVGRGISIPRRRSVSTGKCEAFGDGFTER